MKFALVVSLILCIGAVCSQGPAGPAGPAGPPEPPGAPPPRPPAPQGFPGIPEFLLPPPLPGTLTVTTRTLTLPLALSTQRVGTLSLGKFVKTCMFYAI